MDQNLNNNQNDFLWTLLANPANDAHLYNYNLQRLVNDFPQSGILQALLAHSAENKNLRQASVYFNPKSLYKLINAPSSFIGVPDEKIIIQSNIPSARFNNYNPEPQVTEPAITENYFSDIAAAETIAEPFAEHQPETLHETGAIAHEQHFEETANEFLESHPVQEHLEEAHQIIDDSPGAEEHHVIEQGEAYLQHPVNEVPVQEHHAEEPVAAYQDNEPVEQNWLNHTEETPVGHTEELPAVQEQVSESHENLLAEIKDEVINEIPAAGAIFNYAQGFGHEMVPDAEQKEFETHPEVTHEAAFIQPHVVEDEPLLPAHEETLLPPHEEHATFAEHLTTEEPVHQQYEEAQHTFAEHIAEEEHHAVNEYHQQEAVAHIEEQHDPQPQHAGGHSITEETFDEITGIENIDIEKEFVSNIAATDYFSFDRAFGEHREPEPLPDLPIPEPPQADEPVLPVNATDNEDEPQDVSKYHDEKMPYSFLWWLDKTRKEHADTYQPYVTPEQPQPVASRRKSNTDELQQQYYENIFHITSVEDLDKSLPPPPFQPTTFEPLKLKEQAIIERFIQEEPQIRPQSSDKLDNENKAKKSSEDRDELVSETLAAIYSDQMLYHKAIASYKKLMLRFPEKSRYFAEKIEQLEKKTN